MIAVLGGLDVERNLTHTCTAEGRRRAKAAGSIWAGEADATAAEGKHGGGEPKATLKELAKSHNVGKSTISRLAD
jgi:hypothetical protein